MIESFLKAFTLEGFWHPAHNVPLSQPARLFIPVHSELQYIYKKRKGHKEIDNITEASWTLKSHQSQLVALAL